jgi:hypothetical protein
MFAAWTHPEWLTDCGRCTPDYTLCYDLVGRRQQAPMVLDTTTHTSCCNGECGGSMQHSLRSHSPIATCTVVVTAFHLK